jgi:arylsulfatase A-like enzyme
MAPVLWHFKASRERVADYATKVAVVLVVLLNARFALEVMIGWSHHWLSRGWKFYFALRFAFWAAFAAALCIPRARKQVVTSLDGFLGEKMTRRTAIATVAGAAALAATEFAIAKLTPTVKAALVPQRPNSNILLITFDALSAEDMSLYGYRLPTTPNIDTFARNGTVFTNYYSASTYTTPCVATMLTGMYPSESQVYQMQGRVRKEDATNNLPHAMREAGFATGAFFSNPYAYYLSQTLANGYDVLPEPTFQPGALQHLWDATTPLHQNTGFGSRVEEYADLVRVWDPLWRLPNSIWLRFRAVQSFEHARDVLAELPDGFFLWVHVMTPHDPYHPDAAERGRFLPEEQFRTFEFEKDNGERFWYPNYEPTQQSQVDKRRLAYDEFVATADRTFGAFISDLESSGKLANTTVIVSADHGESFEGGVYQHDTAYLTRPVIHVPLIIRAPGQLDGRRVAVTADQTALAPTILELASQPKPDWMPGRSLVEWLSRDGQGDSEGLAFCQYLEKNSVFEPLRHGTVGVIDGQSKHQYVYNLDLQKGALRPLSEAQIWNLDRTADNPALAQQLHATLSARFPEMVPKPA